MTRHIALSVFLFVAFPLTSTGLAQQVPGNPGFDRLLCMAAGLIDIVPLTEPDEDKIGTAEVSLPHGASGGGSTHTVVYEDSNGSGELDCGDAIISIA